MLFKRQQNHLDSSVESNGVSDRSVETVINHGLPNVIEEEEDLETNAHTKRPTRVESNILGRNITTSRSIGKLPHFFNIGSLNPETRLHRSIAVSDQRPVQSPWGTRFSSDSTRLAKLGYNAREAPVRRVEAGALLPQLAETTPKKHGRQGRNGQSSSERKTQTSNPMQQSVASSVTPHDRGTLPGTEIAEAPEPNLEEPNQGQEVSGFQSFPRQESFSSSPESLHYFSMAGCQVS